MDETHWLMLLSFGVGSAFGAVMMYHRLERRLLNSFDYREMHAAQDRQYREELRQRRPDIAALADLRDPARS